MHFSSLLTVTNTVFLNNSAGSGGGLATMSMGGALIEGCTFIGNEADVGGALICQHSELATVRNCTFDDNKADSGSGIAVSYITLGTVHFENVLVTGGRSGEGLVWDSTGTLTITCSDLYGNQGGDWIGPIAGFLGQDGNIEADPLYCGAQNPDNPWTLDMSSPCLYRPECGLIGAWDSGCDLTDAPAPSVFARLWPCAPNPFNPRTTISFELMNEARVSLAVFDAAGRRVRSLIGGEIRAEGRHALSWDGTDDQGRLMAAGVYICRLESGSTVDVTRLALIK